MKTRKLTRKTLFTFKKNDFISAKLALSTSSEPTGTTATMGTTGVAFN